MCDLRGDREETPGGGGGGGSDDGERDGEELNAEVQRLREELESAKSKIGELQQREKAMRDRLVETYIRGTK